MKAAKFDVKIFLFQGRIFKGGFLSSILIYFITFQKFSAVLLPLLTLVTFASCFCWVRWYDKTYEILPNVSLAHASAYVALSMFLETHLELYLQYTCPYFPLYFIPLIFYFYFIAEILRAIRVGFGEPNYFAWFFIALGWVGLILYCFPFQFC